ncbi:MAG: DNA recombination protein RmuC [Clostridiales bacterium]|nr:DNA recombination protein RmuC [Clostridiales bacterium]
MTTDEILALIAIILSVITLGVALLIFIRVKNSPVVKIEQNEDIKNQLNALYTAINAQSKAIYDQEIRLFAKLSEGNFSTEARINALKDKLDSELKYMLSNNDRNLERIRMTVEEKLSQTLEGTLSQSYKIINERLEAVYRGIGEVNSLAGSVADIKKVFTNVKLRGTWGEVQLATLLEQMLSPNQYLSSVKLNPTENTMVDFAIILPSTDDKNIYLPIDSKFPIEEYYRLVDAQDKQTVAVCLKNLERAVKTQANSIAEKYLKPPVTTDFAIMYLPLEGLYAEVIKMTELEAYLRGKRIIVCGPTNLGALLSTLQTGFKTVAIEKRSSELWQLLSAFKQEFEKFAFILEKTQKKLQEAQDIVESAERKTRTISKKLKSVAEIDVSVADKLLSDNDE